MGSISGREILRGRSKGRKTDGEWRRSGMFDERDISCSEFHCFLPPPSCLWSNYLIQRTVSPFAQEMDSLATGCLFRLLVSHGMERGSEKDRCSLKSGPVVTQERGWGVILLWHFSSLYTLFFAEWWGSQAVSLSLQGVPCVFLCAYVYSSLVLGHWFTRWESSHGGAPCPLRHGTLSSAFCTHRQKPDADWWWRIYIMIRIHIIIKICFEQEHNIIEAKNWTGLLSVLSVITGCGPHTNTK